MEEVEKSPMRVETDFRVLGLEGWLKGQRGCVESVS